MTAVLGGRPALSQPKTESRVVSGATLAFAALLLATALIGFALATRPAHPLADVTHYKFWSRLVTTQGVGAGYSGQYPETYAIYPPVTLYGLGLVGEVYRVVVDPTFDREAALESRWLTMAIRLLALSVHLVAGGVLFGLLAGGAGPWRAVVGAGLYLLNPGALWDLAVWGQPDSWHSVFGLLGTWLVGRGRALAGGGWLGLAALTKPQAWVLLPLAGLALARQGGPGGILRAAIGGGGVTLVVLLPFVFEGRLRELLTLPSRIGDVMPVVSANAHNLWWLVTRGAFPFVIDNQPLGGPLLVSYRQAALGLLLVALGFTLRQVWEARGPWELAGLAAYWGQAWFTLTTGAHENHAFMVFPFLCLVWWRSRFLAVVLVLLIGTFSLNVFIHDFSLAPRFEAALGAWNWRVQMAASSLNLLILGAWSVWLLRPNGGPAGRQERPAAA